jgi:O-antigen/teichoic acid export membrane protein
MLTIARWLGPQEMGVYAVASLALTALEQFSETGLRQAIIQRQEDISSYKVPVRTVQAVRGIILGAIVFTTSPWIAAFFDSPKSQKILCTVAIIPVIRGLEPLFVTLSQKELRFAPIVVLQVLASSVGLTIGLIAAYFRPDAWALVFSSLSVAIVMTVGGHLLSDRRDLGLSFDWRSLVDIRSFGFWIFVNSIVSYIFIRGGDWMIGRLLDVKTLALYQMAFLICSVVTSELGVVMSQLSLPVFSHLQQDRERLQAAFSQTFGIVSIFTLAMAGLVCACSPDFYRLVLGEKWLAALPLVIPLTIWSVCAMFAGILAGVFQALGRPKLWTQTAFLMVCLLAAGIFPMTHWLGALGVAILMAFIGVLMQLIRYGIISRLLGLRFTKVLQHVVTPSVACIVSIVITSRIRSLIPMGNYLTGLIVSAFSLLSVYAICLGICNRWIEPSPRELRMRFSSLFKSSGTIAAAPLKRTTL